MTVENRDQLKAVLAQTQTALGPAYSVEPPSNELQSLRDVIAPMQISMGFLGVTWLAALRPGIEASRVSPAEAFG